MARLSPRREEILSGIIEGYISTGEPVGSKQFLTTSGLNVSPATIRNEMALLTSLGLLTQPHTSSGRVPTQAGLRYYVDSLMGRSEISEEQTRRIFDLIDPFEGEGEKILENAASALSSSTGYAAVCTSPALSDGRIKSAELSVLGRNSCLLVLTTTNGAVRTRVCRCWSEPDRVQVGLFYSIAQSLFVGASPAEITIASVQTAAASLMEQALPLLPILGSLYELANEEAKTVVRGADKLLAHPETRRDAARLFELFENGDRLGRIFGDASGAAVRIGRENAFGALENESLVYAPYRINGAPQGYIGVITPLRADYRLLIASVEFAAGVLGELLSRAAE
ncbi:MAG: heat-inducible transcriptional repressor HrcA [Clostridia bacterium]|nr:heat-inducible transcriptional repressor HrcA [Clostridia bacterium]